MYIEWSCEAETNSNRFGICILVYMIQVIGNRWVLNELKAGQRLQFETFKSHGVGFESFQVIIYVLGKVIKVGPIDSNQVWKELQRYTALEWEVQACYCKEWCHNDDLCSRWLNVYRYSNRIKFWSKRVIIQRSISIHRFIYDSKYLIACKVYTCIKKYHFVYNS